MWPWKSKGKKLREAARAGDVATVRALLEEGDVDVDARDWLGGAALHIAAQKGSAEVVHLLLKANATVNTPLGDGSTPLYYAARWGYAPVVELLLSANATVDVALKNGTTPLHEASRWGHTLVVELLLKANATVDVATLDGRTPLLLAAWCGRAEVVELLLKANAPVDVTDEHGSTPLHKASLMGTAGAIERLLKANAPVDVTDMRADTPLHKACLWHRPHAVRLLLQSGADIHAKNKDNHMPLHRVIIVRENGRVESSTLDTLQALVAHGATWDAKCDEIAAGRKSYNEAPALALCIQAWTQELADGVPFTDIPIEVVKRDAGSTRAYIDSLKTSREILLRRKICLVGSSCAGKTSFVKSIMTSVPQLEHLDDRTIGIDHFPLRFEQTGTKRKALRIHEVTFWDFAGQDAYQVAHSLFFSPRTLFLVCIDLEAFTVAFLQASIMSNMKKQEAQLMDEFIERTVMKWVRMIVARQPDAEFAFIATKEDLLKENTVTERLFKDTVLDKLMDVETTIQEMRSKRLANERSPPRVARHAKASYAIFVSCTSPEPVQSARATIEDLISKSNRSFQMPDSYTQVLEAIVAVRTDAKSHDITTRVNRVFAPVDTLPAILKLKPELCRVILQTLHDLGDVLWYEDLGVELFRDRVILDPLLLIDFIRQVINHNYTGQTMSHTDLKVLPYWNGFTNKEQMKAMKQVLQKFNLVFSADDDRTMRWDSDLIVPAYWQTKTPAAWLWLGDILRINPTNEGPRREQLSVQDILGSTPSKPHQGEAVRVHWEFHFEYGLPSALFDHFVVASVSPFFTFDAGPDWIVYEEEDVTACRLMVGRDPTSLHRTIHVEAVVQERASKSQAEELWDSFERIVCAFVNVMREYPGLDVSSFAWGDGHKKIGLKRLIQPSAVTSKCVKWMPPARHWQSIQKIMRQLMSDDE